MSEFSTMLVRGDAQKAPGRLRWEEQEFQVNKTLFPKTKQKPYID
jgi:hypothetical protein